MMLPITINDITNHLKYYKRKILIQDVWRLIQSTAWLAATSIAFLQLLGRVTPIRNLNRLSVILLVIWIVIVLLIALFKPRNTLSVAWQVDQELDFKERLSSSIQLSSSDHYNQEAGTVFLPRLINDTFTKLQSVDKKSTFQLNFSPKQILVTAIISAAAILLISRPNPLNAIAAEEEFVEAISNEQAEKIEGLVKDLQSDVELSPEEKEALLRELEKLAELLRANEGDRSEALANISSAEQTLLERLDPQLDFKKTALRSISQQLADLAKLNSEQSLNDSELTELMEALANQIGGMDQASLQNLSQAFQKMAAQAAQAGEAGLAEELSSISQSILESDLDSLAQSGERISQAINQARNNLTDQQNLERALAQLQDTRTALSQPNPSSVASQGQPNGNQPGQGQGTNPGQSSGSGQGQGQGNPSGGGGGTQANSLPDSSGSGQANDPTGAGQGTAEENLEPQVFVPWDRRGDNGNQLSIAGQDTGQGQTTIEEQNQPFAGVGSPSLVPYTSVFGSYRDTAYETIQNSYIPNGLKEYVLKYFSLLEP